LGDSVMCVLLGFMAYSPHKYINISDGDNKQGGSRLPRDLEGNNKKALKIPHQHYLMNQVE
jgi:hypothetical protein